uniref:Ubiquitin-like protease family profile domain-containing protein n=1 Tax=Mus spicilegus TaxID=10103 RepID=A0A8C6GPG6_MUSSI
MWQPKQPGLEMKPEASGIGQKRKYHDESVTEIESEPLGQKPKRKCQDGTGMVFKEPGKEPRDQELPREHPSKGQVRKPQGKTPKQLEPLELTEGLPEQAVTGRKPADGGKGHKRPYFVMEENEQSPQKEKYGRLLQHLQCDQDVSSDPHRLHPILTNTWKIKGGESEDSRGSERTQSDREPSTVVALKECLSPEEREKCCSEEKCVTEKKDCIKGEGRRGNSLEPDLSGTQAQIILDSGRGNSLLPNKVAVLAAEKKPITDRGKGREMDQILDITEDMEKEIENALGPGPQEKILSSRFKLQISRGDIQTLENGQWLNDEVINFYMNLLIERNENQGYPALHVFSTFFYPKLKHGGYSSVKRWTQGINLFEKELILVPIHQRVHWSLVVIDLRKRSIVYLDSMGQTGKSICETIFQYLQNESKTRRNIELDPLEWKQYSVTSEEIPLQLNGSDCGMFTCKYADYIARDQPVTFSQQHMPTFRKRMVWEILHSQLL